MQQRPLGTSGLVGSAIGLGGNNFGHPKRLPDIADSMRIINAALDTGINVLDTATSYAGGESERHIGAAISGRRDEAIVVSKFHFRDLGDRSPEERMREQIEGSLRRLDTDRVDVYLQHFPEDGIDDDVVAGWCNDLIDAGKIRAFGNSNVRALPTSSTSHADREHGISLTQAAYSLLDREIERDLLPACEGSGVGLLPYYPLAGGWLTGKYERDQQLPNGARRILGPLQEDERAWTALEALRTFAADRGRTVNQLALAWQLTRPAVASVIAGATREEQIASNADAVTWELSDDDRQELDGLTAWAVDAPVGG